MTKTRKTRRTTKKKKMSNRTFRFFSSNSCSLHKKYFYLYFTDKQKTRNAEEVPPLSVVDQRPCKEVKEQERTFAYLRSLSWFDRAKRTATCAGPAEFAASRTAKRIQRKGNVPVRFAAVSACSVFFKHVPVFQVTPFSLLAVPKTVDCRALLLCEMASRLEKYICRGIDTARCRNAPEPRLPIVPVQFALARSKKKDGRPAQKTADTECV